MYVIYNTRDGSFVMDDMPHFSRQIEVAKIFYSIKEVKKFMRNQSSEGQAILAARPLVLGEPVKVIVSEIPLTAEDVAKEATLIPGATTALHGEASYHFHTEDGLNTFLKWLGLRKDEVKLVRVPGMVISYEVQAPLERMELFLPGAIHEAVHAGRVADARHANDRRRRMKDAAVGRGTS